MEEAILTSVLKQIVSIRTKAQRAYRQFATFFGIRSDVNRADGEFL